MLLLFLLDFTGDGGWDVGWIRTGSRTVVDFGAVAVWAWSMKGFTFPVITNHPSEQRSFNPVLKQKSIGLVTHRAMYLHPLLNSGMERFLCHQPLLELVRSLGRKRLNDRELLATHNRIPPAPP
jgi:hypothetical protein